MQVFAKSKSFYALWHLKEKCFLTLEKESNQGKRECGAYSYNLSTYNGYPIYQAEALEAVEAVMLFDTPWYNASEDHPSHGSTDITQCVPVKVRQIQGAATVPFTLPRVPSEVLGRGSYNYMDNSSSTNKMFKLGKVKGQRLLYIESGNPSVWQEGQVIQLDTYAPRQVIEKIVPYKVGYVLVLVS